MKRPIYALTFLVILVLTGCDEESVTRKGIRLDYYVESFDVTDLGFEPQLRVTYEYGESGKVDRYTVHSFNPDTGNMEEQRYFLFSYTDEKVEQIKGYLAGETNQYIEYTYDYLPNDQVSAITEKNYSSGVNSQANFTYAENGIIKVSYGFSNGGSFEYEFDYATGNILTDKTTRGPQLCSDGQYTYDQHPNPFKDLAYVDYFLTNLSSNNKLTEDVNYVSCAFPSLIPESYAYEYNEKGYPVTCTTTYRSDGSVMKSKKEFFYKSK